MTRSIEPSTALSSPVPAQDDIIARVVPDYLGRARSAAAHGRDIESTVWLQAALILRPG